MSSCALACFLVLLFLTLVVIILLAVLRGFVQLVPVAVHSRIVQGWYNGGWSCTKPPGTKKAFLLTSEYLRNRPLHHVKPVVLKPRFLRSSHGSLCPHVPCTDRLAWSQTALAGGPLFSMPATRPRRTQSWGKKCLPTFCSNRCGPCRSRCKHEPQTMTMSAVAATGTGNINRKRNFG